MNIENFQAWQLTHYTDRLAQARSFKEKQFLTSTLNGLQSEGERGGALYVLVPYTSNDLYKS